MTTYRVPGSPRTKWNAPHVRDKVREYLKANPGDGRFESSDVTRGVLKLLYADRSQVDYWDTATNAQILRVLGTLAKTGELVKFGLKDHKPGPDDSWHKVYYYTPEGLAAAKAATARQREEKRAEQERWAVIYDMLTDMKFVPMSKGAVAKRGDRNLSIPARDWEQLLGIGAD